MAQNIINYQGENGLLYFMQTLKTKFTEIANQIIGIDNKKVDKVDGKALSDNNFTDEMVEKLNGIDNEANKTIVDTVLDKSSQNAISNSAVSAGLDLKAPIIDPTFLGQPKVPNVASGDNSTLVANTAFVQSAINKAMSGITGIEFSIVESLPVTGSKGVIYLVNNHTTTLQNSYDEYIWVSDEYGYEKIGSSTVDLSAYVKSSELVEISNNEIDVLWNSVFGTDGE